MTRPKRSERPGGGGAHWQTGWTWYGGAVGERSVGLKSENPVEWSVDSRPTDPVDLRLLPKGGG